MENTIVYFGIGLGTRTENWELLLEFWSNNDMIMRGTSFQRKNIHKYIYLNNTW